MPHHLVGGRLFSSFVQVTSHDSSRFIVLEFEHKRPKQVLQCTLRQPVLRNMLVKLRLKNALLVLFNNKANFFRLQLFTELVVLIHHATRLISSLPKTSQLRA